MDLKQTLREMDSAGYTPEQIAQYLKQIGAVDPRVSGSDILRAVAQGASFGFSDEIFAGARSLGGGSYEDLLEEERGVLERTREKDPYLAYGSEIAGGLATGGLGAARAAGWAAARGMGRTLPAMATGALEGAIGGAGRGTTPEERTTMGMGDAALGAGLGGAVSGAVGAMGPIARSMPRGRADKVIRQSLEDSDIFTPEQAMDQLRLNAGPEGFIADLSESTRAVARPAALRPGKGRQFAKKQLRERQGTQRARVSAELRGFSSVDKTVNQRLEQLKAIQKRINRSNYGRVMSEPVSPPEGLFRFFNTDEGFGVLKKATNRYESRQAAQGAEGQISRIFRELGADNPSDSEMLEIIWNRVDDLRFWDEVQKTLRGKADKAVRAGDNNLYSYTKGVRDQLLRKLDADTMGETPFGKQSLYRNARHGHAIMERNKEAIELGYKVFLPKSGPLDDTVDKLARMLPSEKQSFMVGVVNAAQELVERGPEGAAAVRKVVKYPSTREKLRTALSEAKDPDVADNLIRRLEQIAEQGETESMILHGSRTAEVQSEFSGLLDALGVGADLATGNVVGAGASLGRRATQAGAGFLDRQAATDIAQRMFAPQAAAAPPGMAMTAEQALLDAFQRPAVPAWLQGAMLASPLQAMQVQGLHPIQLTPQ